MHRLSFIILLSLVIACIGNIKASEPGILSNLQSDTIASEPIILSPPQASTYLLRLIEKENLWREHGDREKQWLQRLADQYNEPFDSIMNRLLTFPFDIIELQPTYIVRHDTLPLRWLDQSLFYVDTIPLDKDPFITQKTIVFGAMDPKIKLDSLKSSDTLAVHDTLAKAYAQKLEELKFMVDSLLQVRDTIVEVFIDHAYLDAKNIQVHSLENDQISPPLLPPGSRLSASILPDSSKVVFSESTRVIMANQESPFYIVPGPNMPDSLKQAIDILVNYTYQRDSILIHIHDLNGQRTPFWLSAGEDDLYRYWVRNEDNDSITIWIGNPAKYDLTLSLEDDIFVERLEKQAVDDIPITIAEPSRSLMRIAPLNEIPVFWDRSLSGSLSLNQTFVENWSRGGNNSLSGMFDITTGATYQNKESNTRWTNSGRLRYGTIWTEEHGSRTSSDIVELNSQFNKKTLDKLDFSAVFYMKTQVAKGYKYPNDSIAISRFLNPGSLTVGVGFEYKPFDKTLINFSALSYRNTFVLDTARINQTTHGIESDKRSRQEMGGQLVVRNELNISESLRVNNRVRLFSNYLRKPQNVDVDWELSLEQQINWYFTIRFNFHLIYNDDVRFTKFDAAGNPVLLPDGGEKKVPRPQINQFLGLTVSLRL